MNQSFSDHEKVLTLKVQSASDWRIVQNLHLTNNDLPGKALVMSLPSGRSSGFPSLCCKLPFWWLQIQRETITASECQILPVRTMSSFEKRCATRRSQPVIARRYPKVKSLLKLWYLFDLQSVLCLSTGVWEVGTSKCRNRTLLPLIVNRCKKLKVNTVPWEDFSWILWSSTTAGIFGADLQTINFCFGFGIMKSKDSICCYRAWTSHMHAQEGTLTHLIWQKWVRQYVWRTRRKFPT